MRDLLDPLILDLLDWVAREERPYADVMEAWRTSCPRLPVWEEANDRGLVTRAISADGTPIIAVTPLGHQLLSRVRAQSVYS
jgi:hypothetical protein